MGNSDHVLSVSIDFLSNSKHDSLFHRIAYDYSWTDWKSLCNHLGDVPWEDIFKFSASAMASEFFDWVQVGIGVYFPHRKYHPSLIQLHGFQLLLRLPYFIEITFFLLYQQNKSLI